MRCQQEAQHGAYRCLSGKDVVIGNDTLWAAAVVNAQQATTNTEVDILTLSSCLTANGEVAKDDRSR